MEKCNPFEPSVRFVGQRQAVQTRIKRRIPRRRSIVFPTNILLMFE